MCPWPWDDHCYSDVPWDHVASMMICISVVPSSFHRFPPSPRSLVSQALGRIQRRHAHACLNPKRASLPCRLALESSQNTNEKQFLTALMTKNWNQNSNAAPFQPLALAELMMNAINNFPRSEQEPKNAQCKLPWKMWDWSTFLLLVSRAVAFAAAKPLWPNGENRCPEEYEGGRQGLENYRARMAVTAEPH